jgi:hypothetical protein
MADFKRLVIIMEEMKAKRRRWRPFRKGRGPFENMCGPAKKR